MNLRLKTSPSLTIKDSVITIPGSKSESNRLLILRALFGNIQTNNLSTSDDTQLLQKALASKTSEIDIHHAGTAMRFLTAYFAIQEGKEILLTGSKRMQERPIGILVDALRELEADIEYEQKNGFPPLRIRGKTVTESQVSLQANVSSQYISALMLIAPALPYGLTILLKGKITSRPYLEMTRLLLSKVGVSSNFFQHKIEVFPLKKKIPSQVIKVESDWSSASYFYSIVALSKNAKLHLSTYTKESLQGDARLVELYKPFGVATTFAENSIILEKQTGVRLPNSVKTDFSDCPDLAQTFVVTCLGLGIECQLTGLHTLKIKETDRLVALQTELRKFGARVEITENSLWLKPCHVLQRNVPVATYNDHRMAMAFAPLAIKVPLEIENASVVSKSFPGFWEKLQQLNFQVSQSL